MLWRQARARVLAQRGEHEKAERLAHEAVEIGETTEDLSSKAETRADLGEILAIAGRREDAADAIEEALGPASRRRRTSCGRASMRERLAELRAEVG